MNRPLYYFFLMVSFLLVGLGAGYKEVRQPMSLEVTAEAPGPSFESSPVPPIATDGRSKEEIEGESKAATELLQTVIEGSTLMTVLGFFDTWLHDLETGKLSLLTGDITAKFDGYVRAAREVGATDKQIQDRLEKLRLIMTSSKV